MVLTTQLEPAGVSFRSVSLSWSTTKTLPLVSTVIPIGDSNRAALFVPSVLP